MASSAIDEQRMSALAHANEIRRFRSKLKSAWRLMEEHEVSEVVAMVVGAPTEWTRSWRISALLRCIPNWGEVAVAKRLRQLGISPQVNLSDLTPGQRLALVELLAPQLLTGDAAQER